MSQDQRDSRKRVGLIDPSINEESLRAKLGVRILVELAPPDSLASVTGAGILPKGRRLEHRRKLAGG